MFVLALIKSNHCLSEHVGAIARCNGRCFGYTVDLAVHAKVVGLMYTVCQAARIPVKQKS